jgi:hypothetical protein
MLQSTPPCGFGLVIDSVSGRPTSTALGTTVTGNAAADTKANYQQIFSGAAVTHDVYGIRISSTLLPTNAETRMVLFDVSTDPAGGTTYGVVIANLGAMPTSSAGVAGAWSYFFPLFIKAGSSIAIRHQCGTGAVDAHFRVWLYCKPTRPEQYRVGSYVDTYGATTASTTGTAVTPGTVSEGNWASIGTLSRPAWYFQACMLIDDTTITNASVYDCDVGVGDVTNKDVVLQGLSYYCTSGESIIPTNYASHGECVREAPTSAGVYGRSQCSATADSNVSMIVYALGG